MLLTDSILVKFLKEGNREVFESVYKKFFGPLYVYAKEYVVEGNIAREIVQDTFLKLWEKRTSLDDNTSLQSYLYRLTRNNCLNYLKRVKVEERFQQFSRLNKLELELNSSALNHSSAEKIISEELEEKINETIESLPPKCRQIFKMSRNDEMKYKDIAKELNLSVKTVENQILKALKILRKHLSDFITCLLILTPHFFTNIFNL
jgi:RNA polymerase sigma-70 factor (ECF subfamily)